MSEEHNTFITKSVLDSIRLEGELAQAESRLQVNEETYEPIPQMSTWELVCEEMVDTQHEPSHYERVVAELHRRGIKGAELETMRMFAWRTAGWLNFEKMMWDWCSLNEKDILMALDWQLRDGEITLEERERSIEYAQKYCTETIASHVEMQKVTAKTKPWWKFW